MVTLTVRVNEPLAEGFLMLKLQLKKIRAHELELLSHDLDSKAINSATVFTKPPSTVLPAVGTTSETVPATSPIDGFRDGMVE